MSSRRVYQLLENEEDDDERWGEARRLIEGLRPDQIDEGHESFNDTLLHQAARHGAPNYVISALITRSGLDDAVNVQDDRGYTPLHISAGNNNPLGVIQRLVNEFNADLNSDGSTALHIAARDGFEEAVLALLGLGVDVRTTDSEGQTPLHVAASVEIAEIMLASPNGGSEAWTTQDTSGRTPRDLWPSIYSLNRTYCSPAAAKRGPSTALRKATTAAVEPSSSSSGRSLRKASAAMMVAGAVVAGMSLLAISSSNGRETQNDDEVNDDDDHPETGSGNEQ